MVETKTLQDLLNAIIKTEPTKAIVQTLKSIELEKIEIPIESSETLTDVLQQYAKASPERPHIYLQNGDGSEQIITYGHLDKMANKIAHSFISKGLKPGETVAIMLPTCEDFFYSFFGVLLAGGIPVPIYPPFRADRIEEYAHREASILQNAEIRFLITFHQAETLSALLRAFIPSLKAIVTANTLLSIKNNTKHSIHIEATNPALIQYTSGSTGAPKGVILTHENLLNNIRCIGKAIEIKPTDVIVSWLPLYHDMRLIGAWLGSLYFGIPIVIMSPIIFLSRPERWLWTIHYHRATLSAGPNFAYELCLRKIDDEALEGLDLSSWRLAFNGAEAVYPKTIRNFTKKFLAYGFKPETFFPVYGLAENSVALTFPPINRAPRIDKINRNAFEKERKAISAKPNEKNYLEFVSCGIPLSEHEIRIVDENDDDVEERTIGTLYFSGPSAMRGYYHNTEATQFAYHDGWWDSGDFAYKADNEIFITGRKKDLIIKAGRNLYPPEIEEIVTQIEGIRKGCVCAFGISDSTHATEKLIVVAETVIGDKKKRSNITATIIGNMVQDLGLPPDDVVLAKPGTIPKTSSGKLKRSACKTLYLENNLKKSRLPISLQLSRLFFKNIASRISQFTKKVSQFFYTSYIGLLLIFTVPILWLAILILSRSNSAKITKKWAQLFLFLCGIRVTTNGLEHLSTEAQIIVCNHASYVDSLILVSILPTNAIFVGKIELLKTPVIRSFFKKLDYATVNRLDFSQSLEDTKQIETKLQAGYSIVLFPEGTFTYATGLRPFKHGAFKIAVENKIPICPIALAGTRHILRGETFLVKPGAVQVTICTPIVPIKTGWHEIVRLRTESRQIIAQYSGEQTLDLIKAGLE